MILKHYDADGSRTNTFKPSPKREYHGLRQQSTNCSKGPISLDTDKLRFISPSLSSIFAKQAVSTLVVAISPEWQVLLPSQRYTRTWLQEVIQRADDDDALLHYSIRALSLLYLGSITHVQDVLISAQSSYTSALKEMQSLISDGNQAFASIQSAAMLLTFFEVCIDLYRIFPLGFLMHK